MKDWLVQVLLEYFSLCEESGFDVSEGQDLQAEPILSNWKQVATIACLQARWQKPEYGLEHSKLY